MIKVRPSVEVIRLEESDYGTFGVMKICKQLFCFTLEPEDLLNEKNTSSIPAQQYICERVNSPKYGNTFEITNVPGRSHVLFHAGNIIRNTKGCILMGASLGGLKVHDQTHRAILNSGKTFSKFLEIMKDFYRFHLTIKEVY